MAIITSGPLAIPWRMDEGCVIDDLTVSSWVQEDNYNWEAGGAEFSYACRMTKHGNNSDTTDTTKIDVVQKLHR